MWVGKVKLAYESLFSEVVTLRAQDMFNIPGDAHVLWQKPKLNGSRPFENYKRHLFTKPTDLEKFLYGVRRG